VRPGGVGLPGSPPACRAARRGQRARRPGFNAYVSPWRPRPAASPRLTCPRPGCRPAASSPSLGRPRWPPWRWCPSWARRRCCAAASRARGARRAARCSPPAWAARKGGLNNWLRRIDALPAGAPGAHGRGAAGDAHCARRACHLRDRRHRAAGRRVAVCALRRERGGGGAGPRCPPRPQRCARPLPPLSPFCARSLCLACTDVPGSPHTCFPCTPIPFPRVSASAPPP
jgi:hypothetical protein